MTGRIFSLSVAERMRHAELVSPYDTPLMRALLELILASGGQYLESIEDTEPHNRLSVAHRQQRMAFGKGLESSMRLHELEEVFAELIENAHSVPDGS